VSVPAIVNAATLTFIDPRRYVAASVLDDPVGMATVNDTTQLAPGRSAPVEETGMLTELEVVARAPTEQGPETTAGVIDRRFFAARSAQNVPELRVLARVAGVADVAAFVRVKVSFCPRCPGT
jgi:hypothetical protein